MYEYPLNLAEGVACIEIDHARWIFDTGSPVSFGRQPELQFAGSTHALPRDYLGVSADDLQASLGVTCAGLLGGDILNQFDHELDLRCQRLVVRHAQETHDGAEIPLTLFFGVPALTLALAGKEIEVFFDTGAQLSLFDPALLEPHPSVGVFADFHPMIGRFEGRRFDITITLGQQNLAISAGELPDSLRALLAMTGAEGILGTGILTDHVIHYCPRRSTLYLAAAHSQVAHASWAEVYDLAYERSFGQFYHSLTEQTLDVITAQVSPPATIVDYGAGTGRLSIPLAAQGFAVTAVEPCEPMLAQLHNKWQHNPAKSGGSMQTNCARMEDFDSPQPFDLALCVFTTLLYFDTEEALLQALQRAHDALKPGGRLLIDIPSRALFNDHVVQQDDFQRRMIVTPCGADHYDYQEEISLRRADGTTAHYRDRFVIRYWPVAVIEAHLRAIGFGACVDLTEHFQGTGSHYQLWTRRTDAHPGPATSSPPDESEARTTSTGDAPQQTSEPTQAPTAANVLGHAALDQLLPAAVTWAEAQSRRGYEQGRPLSATEFEIARQAGVAAPASIRLMSTDDLSPPNDPVLRAAVQQLGLLGPELVGLTLGHTIYLNPVHASTAVLCHECRHVHQYENVGSIAEFIKTYLHQIAHFGYLQAPLEIDAREHECTGVAGATAQGDRLPLGVDAPKQS